MLTAPQSARPDAMNRPASTLPAGPLLLTALIFVAALSRVIPHPPNFSEVIEADEWARTRAAEIAAGRRAGKVKR